MNSIHAACRIMHAFKQPKYNLGLLETPSTSQVDDGLASAGSSSQGPSTTAGPSSSSGPIGQVPYRSGGIGIRQAGNQGREHEARAMMPPPPRSRVCPPSASRTSVPGSSSFMSGSTPRRTSTGFATPRSGLSSARSRTPGSRRTPHVASSATPRINTRGAIITALVEGRGQARGEIGMASIDLKNPTLELSQFSDSQTYVKVMTKLNILNPIEILLPNTACENENRTKLFKIVSEEHQDANIATVQRKYFNETKGMQYIKQLCLPEYSTVEMEVTSKYYCLAATAALLKYTEFIQNTTFASSSLKVIFKGSEQTTMIDSTTAKNLELLQNLRNPKSEHSLYGVLHHTKTVAGTRLLRANILQPPNNLQTIQLRLDIVTELVENEELFYNLQSVISRFLDVDHLLAISVQIPKDESVKTAESTITNIIHLKHTLELVEPLRLALEGSQNPLLQAYAKQLEDSRYVEMMGKILHVLHEDTHYQKGVLNMRNEKCFAVKNDINGLLDVARRTYTEIVDDIAAVVKQLCEEHSLPLRVGYNTSRGFHIQLYCNKDSNIGLHSLPPVFIKATRAKNTISCTVVDLIRMNGKFLYTPPVQNFVTDRVELLIEQDSKYGTISWLCSGVAIETMMKIQWLLKAAIFRVVSELMKEIRSSIGCLYHLAECVGLLDMLLAFAHKCTISDYVRPEFTDTLAIKNGYHPILEEICIEPPVPNNTYACKDHNFILITGPNMSGKSTYLRQLAMLQIMAQIGSYIPAEYASFRLTDQIFTRIGSDDDIETNSSSFMLEMKEINYILQNASDTSLVIIDELGRGTSPDEGAGLCHAICEHLLQLKAFTFFATHFIELADLDKLYPNVLNNHFETSDDGSILNNHKLVRGKTSDQHYGIQLAEISSLPREVVQEAKVILDAILSTRWHAPEQNPASENEP